MRTIYPPRTSNEITKEYYYVVKGMMLRDTTNLIVQKIQHHNGNQLYETYHLISTR